VLFNYRVRVIIQNNIDIDEYDRSRNTPLQIACANNYLDIARLLIENNANTNSTNIKKETPLSLSCDRNYNNIVKLLLENGVGNVWGTHVSRFNLPQIRQYIQLVIDFDKSENQLQYIDSQKKQELLSTLVKRGIYMSMKQILGQQKKPKETLFYEIYKKSMFEARIRKIIDDMTSKNTKNKYILLLKQLVVPSKNFFQKLKTNEKFVNCKIVCEK